MFRLAALIREDVVTVLERDPAAKSRLEVFLCYSGLHAVWFYRINHWLWNHGFRLLAHGSRKWHASSLESKFIPVRRSDAGCSSIMGLGWSSAKPRSSVTT